MMKLRRKRMETIKIHFIDGSAVVINNVDFSQVIDAMNKYQEIRTICFNDAIVFIDNITYIEKKEEE